jgi:hypothetical protein
MNYHNYRSELMLDEGIPKEAGSALDAAIKTVKNVPTLGGAALGSGYGAIQGYKGSGEGQGLAGALGGAVVGGVAGGFAGGGARSLYKNVPKGFKQWRKGHKGLAKELERAGIKGDEAKFLTWKNMKSYVPGVSKSKRYDFVKSKGEEYKRVGEHLGAGKRGKELVKADEAAAKSVGAYGDVLKGRHRLVGSAVGGTAALGYGAYQLKGTRGTTKKTEGEEYWDNVERNVDNRLAARRAAGRSARS